MSQAVSHRTGDTKCKVSVTTNATATTTTTTTTAFTTITTTSPNLDNNNSNTNNTLGNSAVNRNNNNSNSNNISTLLNSAHATTIPSALTTTSAYVIDDSSNINKNTTTSACSSGSLTSSNNNDGGSSSSVSECGGAGFGGGGGSGRYRFGEPSAVTTALTKGEPVNPLLATLGVKPPPPPPPLPPPPLTRQARNSVVRSPNSCAIITSTTTTTNNSNNNNSCSTTITGANSNCNKAKCSSFVDIYKKQLAFLVQQSGDSKSSVSGSSKKPTEPLEKKKRTTDTVLPASTPGSPPTPVSLQPLQPSSLPSPLQAAPLPAECHQVGTKSSSSGSTENHGCNNSKKTQCWEATSPRLHPDRLPSISSITTTLLPSPSPAVLPSSLTAPLPSLTDEKDRCHTACNQSHYKNTSGSGSCNKNNSTHTASTTLNYNHNHNSNSSTDSAACFDHVSTTFVDNKFSAENNNNHSTKWGPSLFCKNTQPNNNNNNSSSNSRVSFFEDQQRPVVTPLHVIDSKCDGSKTKTLQQQQSPLPPPPPPQQQQPQQLQEKQMPPTAKHLVATTRTTAIAAAAVDRSSGATSEKELHTSLPMISPSTAAASTTTTAIDSCLQQDDRRCRNVLHTTTTTTTTTSRSPPPLSTKAVEATTTTTAAVIPASSALLLSSSSSATEASNVSAVTTGSASAITASTPAVTATATSTSTSSSSSSSSSPPPPLPSSSSSSPSSSVAQHQIICTINDNSATTNTTTNSNSTNNNNNNNKSTITNSNNNNTTPSNSIVTINSSGTNTNVSTTVLETEAAGDVHPHLAIVSAEGGMSRKRSAAGTTVVSSGTSGVKRMMCKVSSSSGSGDSSAGGGSTPRDTGIVVGTSDFPATGNSVSDEGTRGYSTPTDDSGPGNSFAAALEAISSNTATTPDFPIVALPCATSPQNAVDSVPGVAGISNIDDANGNSSNNTDNHNHHSNIHSNQTAIGLNPTPGLPTNTATETVTFTTCSTTAIAPTTNNDSNVLATNTTALCSLSSCIDTGSNSCLGNESASEAQQSQPPPLPLPPTPQQKQLSPPLPLQQNQLSSSLPLRQSQLSPPLQQQQQQNLSLQPKQLSLSPSQQKLPTTTTTLKQQTQPPLQLPEPLASLSLHEQLLRLQQIPSPEQLEQLPQQEDRENNVVLVPVSNDAIVTQQPSQLLMMMHQKCDTDTNNRDIMTAGSNTYNVARLAAATNSNTSTTTTNVSSTCTFTTATTIAMNSTNINTSQIISPPLLQCSQPLPPPLSAPLLTTTTPATFSNHALDTFLSPLHTDSTIVPVTNSTCIFPTSLSTSSSSPLSSSSPSSSTPPLSSPALFSLLPPSSIVSSSQTVGIPLQNTSMKQTSSVLMSQDAALFVSRSNAEPSVQSAMVMPPSTPIQCQIMPATEAASSDCSSDENSYDDCASSEPSSKPDIDSPESFVASTQTGFDNSEHDDSTEDSIGNSASYTGISSSVYAKDNISKVLDSHYKRIKDPALKSTYDMEYGMKLCQDFCLKDGSNFARDVLLHSGVDHMCKSYNDDDDDDDNVYKCSYSLPSKKKVDSLDCKKTSPTSGLVSDLLRCTTAIADDHSYCWSVSKTQEPESLLRDAHPCDDEVSDSSSLDDIPDKQEHLTFLTQNAFLKNSNPKSVEMKTSFYSPASQSIRKQIVGKDRKIQLNNGCVSLDSSGFNICSSSSNFKMATNATNMLCKTIPNNLINNNDNNINNSSCSGSFNNNNNSSNNNNNNVVDSITPNGDKFVTDFSSSGLEEKTHLSFNSYYPFESKFADERQVNGLSSPMQLSELSPNSRSPKITPLKNVNNRMSTQGSPKIGSFRIGTYGSISNKEWEENTDSDTPLTVGSISMSDKKRETFTYCHKKDLSDRLSASEDQKNTGLLYENSMDVDDTVKGLSSDGTNRFKLQEESAGSVNFAHILHDHDYCIRIAIPPTKSEFAKELLFSSKLLPSSSSTSKISNLSSTKTTVASNNSSSSPTNTSVTTEAKSWRKPRNSTSTSKSIDMSEDVSVSSLPLKIEEPDQESAETSYETSRTNESKLKITGSFQNDYVYFLNKTARSRRRFSHEILPDKNLQSKHYSDIVIPHLTDADIEALKRRQNKSSPMLDASAASKNPCDGSNDMEIDSKLICSVMNMDNPNMDPDMEYTLPGLDNGFVSESMSTNTEVCFTPEDMDILYSAFKMVENANGFRSLDEIRKTADSFDGIQKQMNSSVSMLQEDQINPCMTAVNESKEPFVNSDCMSSEEAINESAQVHAHGLPPDNNLLDFENMPINDMHNMMGNERDKFKAPTLACSQESDLSQSDLNNLCSSNPSANLTDLQIPSLEKFDLLSGDLPLKLDKPDLFLEPTVEDMSTVPDCNPPWIVTVTMFWNDLPAIMMDHHPYIRLVDIHKQILPAKDTGILKKRCQLLGLPVQNCTEFQRYFLVQYGRAYNSKSTLVISKDDAKSLIGYYVNPPPRAPKGEGSEDEHGSPEKRVLKTNGSLEGRMKKQAKTIGSKRQSLHKKNLSLENQLNRERTLSEKSDDQFVEKQSASPSRFDSTTVSEAATSTTSAASKVRVTSSSPPLPSTRSRLRHKKINFLDLIRGESGSSSATLLPSHSSSSSIAPTSSGSADISPLAGTTPTHSLRSSSASSPSSSSSSSSSTLSALFPPLPSSLSPPPSPSSDSVLSSNKMHSTVALAGEEAPCTRKQGLAVSSNRLKSEKSIAGSRQQKNGNKGQVMPSLMLLQQQQEMNSLLTSECSSSLSSSPDAVNSGGGNIRVNKTKRPPNDCKLVSGGGGSGGAGRRCYNQKNGLNGRRQKNGDEKEAAGGSHCISKMPAKISKWAKPNRGIGRRIKKNTSNRLKVKLKLQTPNHSLPGGTNDFRFINSTTNYDSNYNNTNINNIINNNNNNNNNGNINNNTYINKNISKNRNIPNNSVNNNYNCSSRSTPTINSSKSITATKALTTTATTMPVSTATTTTTTPTAATTPTNNSSKPPSHKKRLRVNKMQSIFDVIHVLREDVVADRCIGVQAGELLTNLYIDRDSKCIKCTTCTELFSIVHFMQHHQHSNSGVSCHSDLPLSAAPLSQQQQQHHQQQQHQQQQQQQLSSPFLSSSSSSSPSLSTPPTSLPPSLPTPDTVRELSSTPCMWRLRLNSNTSESQQKLWKHFLKKQHQLQNRQQSPLKSGNGIRFSSSANMLLLESQPSNLEQGGTSAHSSTSRVSSRKRKQKQFYPIENYEFKTALSSAAHGRNSAGIISSEQSSRHYGGAVVKGLAGAASGRAMSCSMGLGPSKKAMKLSHQPCKGAAAMSVSSVPGSAKAVILPGVSGSSAFSMPQQTLNPTATTAHKKNRNNKSSHTTTNRNNISNTTNNRNHNNSNNSSSSTATNKNSTTTNKNNPTTTTTTTNNNNNSSSLSENVVTLKNEPELLNFTALQTDDYDM